MRSRNGMAAWCKQQEPKRELFVYRGGRQRGEEPRS